MVMSLSCLKSVTIQSFFLTGTSGNAQGLFAGLMIPCGIHSSNCSCRFILSSGFNGLTLDLFGTDPGSNSILKLQYICLPIMIRMQCQRREIIQKQLNYFLCSFSSLFNISFLSSLKLSLLLSSIGISDSCTEFII